MSFAIVIQKEAQADVLQAFNYYEDKQLGVGEKFLEALQDRLRQVAVNPTHFGYIGEDPKRVLRDVRLEKFPFLIVFEISGSTVVVYAIHNTYKHPRHKLRKV